ncbi:MAG: glycosyltransferase [Bacteroidetes bacterium]|nr:MAG: glycosyltransferase [Bacteroidota bacterium]
MTYHQARLKQRLEHLAILPLVWLGYAIAQFYKKPHAGQVFLIYPNRDRGGSYKVNADIAQLLSPYAPLQLFTKKELNGGFRHLFNIQGTTQLDVSHLIDNKWYHFLNVVWRGIIAGWVNRCPQPVVFGGECIYFYKLLPHLRSGVKTIELCHVNRWLNYTQAFVPYIQHRVFSTQKILRDHAAQYTAQQVPAHYHSRLQFIDNKVDIPLPFWPSATHLQVLFIGRGSPQKRVPLMAQIAWQVKQIAPNIQFTLVGDVEELVPQHIKPLVTILTHINQAAQLTQLYRQHHVLVLTSLFEGLPIVVMDMMAQGRPIISTAVDGIPDYVQHEHNGLLINDIHNPEAVVAQGVAHILRLHQNPALLQQLAHNARQFACAHFSSAVFDKSYLQLLAPKG